MQGGKEGPVLEELAGQPVGESFYSVLAISAFTTVVAPWPYF